MKAANDVVTICVIFATSTLMKQTHKGGTTLPLAAIPPSHLRGSLFIAGYWSIKGLGAPLRMMLCYAGVSFESLCYDVKMDAETGKLDARSWFSPKKSLKTSNPFINLPYVVDESSGLVVSQTNACFSYLGRKLGLWGTTQEEVVMCETLLSEIMDLRNAMTKYAYNQDHDKVQEDGVELLDNVKGKNGIMQKFELHLGSVVGGFLLGGKVRW